MTRARAPIRARAVKDKVAELEREVERLRVENKRLQRTKSVSEGDSFGKSKERRGSQAKLEKLEETQDEQTQRYIKSQFVSSETLDENSSSSTKSGLDILRRDANAIVASNRLRKLSQGSSSEANGKGDGSPSPQALPPLQGGGLRHTHPAAAVVPARHLPPSITEAELDEVLAIKAQIEACSWEADTLVRAAHAARRPLLRKPARPRCICYMEVGEWERLWTAQRNNRMAEWQSWAVVASAARPAPPRIASARGHAGAVVVASSGALFRAVREILCRVRSAAAVFYTSASDDVHRVLGPQTMGHLGVSRGWFDVHDAPRAS